MVLRSRVFILKVKGASGRVCFMIRYATDQWYVCRDVGRKWMRPFGYLLPMLVHPLASKTCTLNCIQNKGDCKLQGIGEVCQKTPTT